MYSAMTLSTLNTPWISNNPRAFWSGLHLILLFPFSISESDLSLLPQRPSDPQYPSIRVKAHISPYQSTAAHTGLAVCPSCRALSHIVGAQRPMENGVGCEPASTYYPEAQPHQGNERLLQPGSLQTLKVNSDLLLLMPTHKFPQSKLKARGKYILREK